MAVKLKTKKEIEILREGGKILAAVLDELKSKVVVGVTTGELEDLACTLIESHGGRPSFKGYNSGGGTPFPSALCTSINNEVVHGPAHPSRVLRDGDIIGIDIGMEYPFRPGMAGFYTDMAVTVAVGKISRSAERLMMITKEALELGIAQVGPGKYLSDIAKAVEGHAKKHGYGVVKELVGHGVGYAVHEEPNVPNFWVNDGSMKDLMLKSGMVIAIEPMFNERGWRVKTASDRMTIVTADGGLSAHFEHTVAVTEEGCVVITDL
jgi:methionyl aminopeptidase